MSDIKGYRELTPGEIAHINAVKDLGTELDKLVNQCTAAGGDPRWIAIGKTHLQEGMMALTRSIAKPTNF